MTLTKNDKRFLVLFFALWFVWSERTNFADFFAGFYDGAGNLPSQSG
jgi:hypothetical protein